MTHFGTISLKVILGYIIPVPYNTHPRNKEKFLTDNFFNFLLLIVYEYLFLFN